MTISTTTELRAYLIGYLNQRKSAYAALGNMGGCSRVKSIANRFDLISKMPYERHCAEVSKCASLLYATLPHADGAHAKIRLRMLDFISQCKTITKEYYGKYYATGGQTQLWPSKEIGTVRQ